VCNKLAWSIFYGNLELPELDKIQNMKELLCVKYGLISWPLFDVLRLILSYGHCILDNYFTCLLPVIFLRF